MGLHRDYDTLGKIQDNMTAYERWQKNEGIPVIRGYYIDDLTAVELAPWERKGGMGAFVNLEGTEELNDAYVCEIAPGGSLKPQKSLLEELVYIVKGRGATSVWHDPQHKQTFEWQEGSVFSIPLNAWHQHFNLQGNEPVRYFAVTLAPLVMNLFHNEDFIFNNPYRFIDRFNGEDQFFSSEGVALGGRVWDTNFVSDVRSMKLQDWSTRGAGGSNVMLELANSTLGAHISQFPVGTYKKAHRHGPGAHVIIVSGEGYSLLWEEGKPIKEIPWKKGSVLVPPDNWFHQHFNLGNQPARYLALRISGVKHVLGKAWDPTLADKHVKEGGMQIEYHEEDPWVHQHFEEELAKRGLHSKMKETLER